MMMIRNRSLYRWHTDSWPLLTSILVSVVLLAIAIQAIWPLEVDVGGADRRFVSGFNAIEDFNGTSVRWTDGDATLSLPRPPSGGGTVLRLRLLTSRPLDQPAPTLQLQADGRLVGGFAVAQEVAGARVYRVLVPPAASFDWATRLSLRSDTFTPSGDQRLLGVVVDRARLGPLANAPFLPPLWLVVWSMLFAILSYGLLRMVGLGQSAALASVVALAALVAIGVALRPLEVLPFVRRIVLLFAAGCIGVWAVRLLAPSLAQGQRWAVRGSDVPLYLAVGWWLGPLFQLLMLADGAFNVGPAPATRWIGGALLVALVAVLGGWYALRGKQLGADERSAFVTRASLLLFAGAAAVHLVWMLWFAFTRSGPDFWILFKGARDWARGGSLYDLVAITTNHFGHVFKVPPFYGMLFVPFVFQDGERILFFHRVLNTVLICATALVWVRVWRVRLMSVAAASFLVLLNFRSIADVVAFGQIDLVLLFVLVLALWALRREQDVWAGALVALGTLLKIYPVLLLAFFVVKGRWRALFGFVLGMFVFNGIAIAVMGWEMHRVYLFEVLPRIGGTTAYSDNQTIAGFLARLVASPKDAAILHNPLVTLLSTALAGLGMLGACLLALRPARTDSTTYALQYSLFLLLMVLAVPAAWMHYETLLAIPFAALLLHWRAGTVPLRRVVILALAFGLITYGNQWSFYDGTVMGVLTILGISYKFYGMLLLGGVLTTTLLEEPIALPVARWARPFLVATKAPSIR